VEADYAEALRRIEQLPENLRPAVHRQYQQTARRVWELQNTLTTEIERANLENALKTLGELQSLQPKRWQQEPRLAAVVSGLVKQADQLLQEGRTKKAGEVLAGIPASLQTDAVRKVVQAQRQQQQRRRDEELLKPKFLFSGDVAKATQAALAKSFGMPEEWTNSVGMKFRPIPAGTYKKMTLTKPFWLGVHQVTQGQWQQVMGTTPWKGKANNIEGSDVAASYVSWDDAVAFCEKLSRNEGKRYRLPTESEWEWACRAGTTTEYSFGDNEKRLGEYAWWGGIRRGNCQKEQYAHRVGQKKSNPFGLYDVHGNVWEWCGDWHGSDNPMDVEAIDPQGPATGSFRVLRGGSWFNEPIDLRSSFRLYGTPVDRGSGTGCRLVLECG
jgi:formylglycine-generating enzyme required for sulfatase activity